MALGVHIDPRFFVCCCYLLLLVVVVVNIVVVVVRVTSKQKTDKSECV